MFRSPDGDALLLSDRAEFAVVRQKRKLQSQGKLDIKGIVNSEIMFPRQ